MWVSKLESCICGYFWHKQICMCIFWELTIPSGTIYKWYSKLLIKVIPKLFLNSMLFGSCKPGAFGAQYKGSLLSWEASGSGQSSLFPPPDVADAPTSPHLLICLSAHLLPLLHLSHPSWGPSLGMHRPYRWLFHVEFVHLTLVSDAFCKWCFIKSFRTFACTSSSFQANAFLFTGARR